MTGPRDPRQSSHRRGRDAGSLPRSPRVEIRVALAWRQPLQLQSNDAAPAALLKQPALKKNPTSRSTSWDAEILLREYIIRWTTACRLGSAPAGGRLR